MSEHATPTGPALEGRVALVTGASRGIGAATARAFSTAGAKLVLAARDENALHALVDDITGCGGSAVAIPTDVQYPESMCRLVEQTVGAYGRLDVAVNCAADNGHRPTPLAEVSIGDFDRAIAVSLRGVFLAMKYEIPAMLQGGGGAIVNMSSTAAQRPVGGLAGYVTAKAALEGLTRTAALDYAAAGIRINALAPGPILTEQLHRAGADAQRTVAATLPARRLGSPEEVAAAAVWLCGPGAEFVTGTTVTVDGGLLAGMASFAPTARREEQR
jgi:NAD(P)-dependent dehydrogenase (short-subunit alcohol dehydrogenase family)